MKQLDLFGNEIEITEDIHKHGGNRYKKMQEIHGITQGKHCKTCKHLAATDIRLKDVACGKYEEIEVQKDENI